MPDLSLQNYLKLIIALAAEPAKVIEELARAYYPEREHR